MTYFNHIIIFEFRRFFSKRNLVILLLIFISMVYLVNTGIYEHKGNLEKASEFQELEALRFKKVTNYAIYSVYGVYLFFNPAPAEFLFKNTFIKSDLKANIDSITKLKVFNSFKDRPLFAAITFNSWDFPGILLLFGSLIALFWGYEVLREKEYVKFLSSFISHKKVFFYLIFSRIVLLILVFIFFLGIILIMLRLHDIGLSTLEYINLSGFFMLCILMLLFFFFAGVIIGLTRSGKRGISKIIAVWVIFIFLIPGIIHTLVENNALDGISDYKTELEKFGIVTDFERRAVEQHGKFDINNIEKGRKVIENYWKRDYKEIEKLEERLKGKIVANINRYRNLSILFPNTFYHITANEVSSRGYGSFIDFYSYLQELKRKFVRFWIDRVYYKDFKVMVNFIKGKENHFFAKSRLPGNFWTGVLIILLYIVSLFSISYFSLRQSLFKITDKEISQIKEIDRKFKRGEISVWRVAGDNFSRLMYNLLSGENRRIRKSGIPVKLMIDDVNIAETRNTIPFIYFCLPEEIPADIKVKDFILLFAGLTKATGKEKKMFLDNPKINALAAQKFGQLDKREKREIFIALSQLGKSSIYLFNNVATDMPVDYAIRFKERLEQLSSGGAVVLYLTTNDCFIFEKGEQEPYFYETNYWTELVDHHKSLKLAERGKRTDGKSR